VSTEAKHGPNPAWERPLLEPDLSFSATVVGHYTQEDGWACAGVTAYRFASQRPIKQRAELLALRSAFKDWFEQESLRLGFQPEGAYRF
jgi:hypothetical protein